jgi:hypothetical protein
MSRPEHKHSVPSIWYDELWEWLNTYLPYQVDQELYSAAEKHGLDKVPTSSGMPNEVKFIVLSEEIGEVARSLTYDNADPQNLKDELLQVIAMASAWLYSLRDEEYKEEYQDTHPAQVARFMGDQPVEWDIVKTGQRLDPKLTVPLSSEEHLSWKRAEYENK